MRYLLLILVLLTLSGCGYQRGDKVELLDGRTAIVTGSLLDNEISVLIVDDSNKMGLKEVIDTLQIKRKIVDVEKK